MISSFSFYPSSGLNCCNITVSTCCAMSCLCLICKMGCVAHCRSHSKIQSKIYSKTRSHLWPCVVLFVSYHFSLHRKDRLFSGVSISSGYNEMLTSADLCMCPDCCSEHNRKLQMEWFSRILKQFFVSSALMFWFQSYASGFYCCVSKITGVCSTHQKMWTVNN